MIDSFIKDSCKLLKRNCLAFQKIFYSDSSLVSTAPSLKSLAKIDRVREKNLFEKYFIENLFLNKFQPTILEYPEIDTLKEVDSLKRQCRYAQTLLTCEPPSQENVEETEKKKVVNNLKKLQLTGFKVPVKQGGYGYQNMEFLYMQETLSTDPSLSKTIAENENLGIDTIKLFGSTNQKEKYLPKLASGESMVCFAHVEANDLQSLNLMSVNAKARLAPDGEKYILSGKKTFVYNATHADAIIFSANVIGDLEEKEKNKVTLFLVDKNSDGIIVHEHAKESILKGVDICTVSFNDVVIPISCALGAVDKGDAVIKKIFSSNKANSSVQCLMLTKKLLGIIINHCLSKEFFKKKKYKHEFLRIKVGNIVSKLYGMESMSYLVAGRMDNFDQSDLYLESLILRIFSVETLQFVFKEALEIIDNDIYSNDSIGKIIEEYQFILASDYSNNNLKQMLSTAGCKHVLKEWNEKSVFTKLLDLVSSQKVNQLLAHLHKNAFIPKGKLQGYVHLMFSHESKLIEDLVFHLMDCTEYLIKKHGENIYSKELELNLLADLVISIYAMVAILGRASRAYCTGLRHQEVDKSIAFAEASRIHLDAKSIVDLIRNESFIKNLKAVNSHILDIDRYAEKIYLFQSVKQLN